jgi:hypothetical protein
LLAAKATFDEAETFCRLASPSPSIKSDLFIIDTERENDVVASWYGFMEQVGPTWIGLKETAFNSNYYTWVDPSTPSLHENWVTTEPKVDDAVQQCAALIPSKMMDVGCTKRFSIVCKSDLQHQPKIVDVL